VPPVSPSNTMWPEPRPTCVPSFVLIRPTVWPQCTNVTDRQDRQRTDSIGRTVLHRVAQQWNQYWCTQFGFEYYSHHILLILLSSLKYYYYVTRRPLVWLNSNNIHISHCTSSTLMFPAECHSCMRARCCRIIKPLWSCEVLTNKLPTEKLHSRTV